MTWDPDLYLSFSTPRMRPAFDLIGAIDQVAPESIVDLGCGSGEITVALAGRWPSARVLGIDRSAEMLARVPQGHERVSWELGDIDEWQPDRPQDVVFSNAALHWLDHHETLLPRLAESLNPQGVLAVQMPANHSNPSHQIAYELATGKRWKSRLGHLVRPQPVADSSEYAHMLDSFLDGLNIWTTTYLQILSGEHAVSRWVEGSFLRPFLNGLGKDDADEFLAEYRAALAGAYRALSDGRTLFPFTRLFIVGRRTAT